MVGGDVILTGDSRGHHVKYLLQILSFEVADAVPVKESTGEEQRIGTKPPACS